MITTTLRAILGSKSPIASSVITGVMAGIIAYGLFAPQVINADLKNSANAINPASLVKNGRLTICKLDKSSYEVVRTIKNMVFTAYTSTKDQTDDSPFITASGEKVHEGVLATNILAFGTKVRIPKLFGDRVFIVKDRMNKKYDGMKRADIWFPGEEQGKKDAFKFGVKSTYIEIVES